MFSKKMEKLGTKKNSMKVGNSVDFKITDTDMVPLDAINPEIALDKSLKCQNLPSSNCEGEINSISSSHMSDSYIPVTEPVTPEKVIEDKSLKVCSPMKHYAVSFPKDYYDSMNTPVILHNLVDALKQFSNSDFNTSVGKFPRKKILLSLLIELHIYL
ncbi:hypothetical protein NPIL_348221 [Nephila pilipes]|uniref:Uncharacterized protein n=1 Tax=Nephila pilipes TaxID=299642 RepID=A0A8X6QG21_NEPPI|nr:hypothetical protein NPIL_348221 [Nephila pilipes]